MYGDFSDGYECRFQIGDYVRSVNTGIRYYEIGKVIDLKKPSYLEWGVLKISLCPVVRFKDGTIMTLPDKYLAKVSAAEDPDRKQ